MFNNLGKRALDRVASLPAALAYRCTRLAPVDAWIERKRELSVLGHRAPRTVRVHDKAVVAALVRDGVFVSDLGKLNLGAAEQDGIMADCQLLGRQLADRGTAMRGSASVMIQASPADLMSHPAIYRWGLTPPLLQIAEAFFRGPVAYDGPILFHTPADGREVGTRRWHIDREDQHVLKICLYLTNVRDDDGPFQILKPRPDTRAAEGSLRYVSLDSEGLSRKMGSTLAADDIVTCTGKAGTLVFADTARSYHRGKPATRCDRSAVFFSYFARTPRHPFFCHRSGLSRRQVAQLIDGLNPRQRAAALWRDSLPWPVRMIPSSRT